VIRVHNESGPTRSSRRFAHRRSVGFTGFLAFICLLASTDSSAHIVMGTRSLHLLVVEADLVLRARVTNPDAVFVSEDGLSRRQLIEVEVLETLKGRTIAPKVRFAQDGHDVARYATGQEALFFLRPIAKSRELRMLAVPGGPSHVSGQEHAEKFLIEGAHGQTLLSGVRKLARSESASTTVERVTLIRAGTLELLTSGDARLGASGLASLVMTPQAKFVTRADLPRLEKFLKRQDVSIGLRAGLTAELERRGLIDGPAHWISLLENASPSDLPVAIRAAGPHPSDAVNATLLRMLKDPKSKTEIAAECAIALGASHNVGAVSALSDALMKGKPRLRNAAIRGLGQIGGPESHAALDQAAQTHPDSATRKRARAELRSAPSSR
jgi:hypothetical protein